MSYKMEKSAKNSLKTNTNPLNRFLKIIQIQTNIWSATIKCNFKSINIIFQLYTQ